MPARSCRSCSWRSAGASTAGIRRKERGSFRGWLRRVTRNLVINWLKQRERRVIATGGSDLQAMLDMFPAESDAETVEFDQELRRALFQRAAEQVRAKFSRRPGKRFGKRRSWERRLPMPPKNWE